MSAVGVAVGGVVVAGGLVGLDRMANSVLRPTPRHPDRTVPDSGLAHEDFTIPSGRHELACWLLHPETSTDAVPDTGDPLLLLAHGWGASYGTVLHLAEPLVRSGHDVLLFDARGHGRNAPARFVTVRNFRDDLMAVARYAGERFPGRPIVLVGHSFGGAASILAAAEGVPLLGLVLIATPSDILRITSEVLTDRGLPGAVLTRVLRPFWWWRLGGTFRTHSPLRRISELRTPILLIHPENDERVALYHAERLAGASGARLHLVPGRGHTDVLEAEATRDLVLEFLDGLADR